jgi:hypothetical protein
LRRFNQRRSGGVELGLVYGANASGLFLSNEVAQATFI